MKPITLAEFTERVVKPSIIAGIKRGDYDLSLGVWLAECPPDDTEILEVAFQRVIHILSKEPIDPFEGLKVGSQLRIRIPTDYTVTNGPSVVTD